MIEYTKHILGKLEECTSYASKEDVTKLMKEYFQSVKRNIFANISSNEASEESIKKFQVSLRRRLGDKSESFRKALDEICISDLNNRIKTAKENLKLLMAQESEVFCWIGKNKWCENLPDIKVSEEEFWQQTDKFIQERIEAYEKRTGNKWEDYVRETTNNKVGESNANGVTELQQ